MVVQILVIFPSVKNISKENKFIIDLQNFIKAKKDFFLLEPELTVRQTRNTVPVKDIVDTKYNIVKNYISNFWTELKKKESN